MQYVITKKHLKCTVCYYAAWTPDLIQLCGSSDFHSPFMIDKVWENLVKGKPLQNENSKHGCYRQPNNKMSAKSSHITDIWKYNIKSIYLSSSWSRVMIVFCWHVLPCWPGSMRSLNLVFARSSDWYADIGCARFNVPPNTFISHIGDVFLSVP